MPDFVGTTPMSVIRACRKDAANSQMVRGACQEQGTSGSENAGMQSLKILRMYRFKSEFTKDKFNIKLKIRNI